MLLERLGIKTDLSSKEYVENFERYRITKFRSWNIPLLTSLLGDYGITGKDVFLNDHRSNLDFVEDLPFGYSQIWVMGKRKKLDEYEQPIKVGSPYQTLARNFFERRNYLTIINPIELKKIEGSWEGLVELGLVDVVVDCKVNGRTSTANGLKLLEKVLDSNAILLKRGL